MSEKYDTFHDYRPDPEFEIKSHLYDGVKESYDESGIFSDELKDVVSKGEGLLEDCHDKFYKFLIGGGAKYAEPLAEESDAQEPGKSKWADLKPEEQFFQIRRLPWDRLVENLAVQLKSIDEKMKPDNEKDWHKDFINSFPYLEALFRKLPDFFMIKEYLLEINETLVQGQGEILTDIAKEKDDIDAARKEVRPQGRKIMWGIAAFRGAYVNFMLKTLRDKGLKITHKIIGDTSYAGAGYNIVLGGEDDVAAACELFRGFRAEWRFELSFLFDANICCRHWMIVDDKTLSPSEGKGKDDSLQAQAMYFVGDIYSLLKIRRNTSKVEWAAFCNAINRDIKIDDLNAPEMKDIGGASIMQGSGVPMLKRLELVSDIYRTQFVEPLIDRAGDIHKELKGSPMGQELNDLDKKVPLTLEKLFEFDLNGTLRAMTMAYLELMAKSRLLEKQLESSHKGSFKWYQNDATEKGKGKLVEKISKFSPEGMMIFLEKYTLLTSEAGLLGIDSYYSQGAEWCMESGAEDSELTELQKLVNARHRVHSFNEQTGDAIKELRKYLSRTQEHEIRKRELAAMDKSWEAMLTAPSGEEDYQRVKDKYANRKSKIPKHGFYRISKHEKRMGKELEAMIKSLEESEVIKKRKLTYQTLYPDLTPPDELDLEKLKLEVEISKLLQDNINELLNIRKGAKGEKKDYSGLSRDERMEAANELIVEMTKEGGKFRELVSDEERKDSQIIYSEADPDGTANKYASITGEGAGSSGLRYMLSCLLHNAAAVNKHARSILSRGPLEITARNFAAN